MQLDSASRLDLLLTKTNKSTQVLNPTSIKAYEGLLAESQRQLSSDLPSLVQSLSMCDPENSQSYSSEHEQFKRACNAKILDIQLQLADQLSASPIPVVSPVHPSTTFKSIEMEKSKAPTFSGKTIDYPEFKRGWQKVAGVCWDDGNQVEQLKYKVDSRDKTYH